jgi:cytochrome c2
VWAGVLVALSFLVAVAAGGTLYWQNRTLKRTQAEAITQGNADRGKAAISLRGCGGCHMIPGIAGAIGQVGPDLTAITKRSEIAGKFPNDPDVMVRWLMHPQALEPASGMPEMGISQAEARDIAAYLYSKS